MTKWVNLKPSRSSEPEQKERGRGNLCCLGLQLREQLPNGSLSEGDARSHPCTMGAAVRRQRAGVGSAEAERPRGEFEAGFDLRRIIGDSDADDVERRSDRDAARDERGAATAHRADLRKQETRGAGEGG